MKGSRKSFGERCQTCHKKLWYGVGNASFSFYMKTRTLSIVMTATSLLSIVTGLLYILDIYGPTEAEARFWGITSVGIGFLLIALILLGSKNKTQAAIEALTTGTVIMLQVMPISLWTTLDIYSDHSDFVPHPLFALPHVLLVILGSWCLYGFLQGRRDGRT